MFIWDEMQIHVVEVIRRRPKAKGKKNKGLVKRWGQEKKSVVCWLYNESRCSYGTKYKYMWWRSSEAAMPKAKGKFFLLRV